MIGFDKTTTTANDYLKNYDVPVVITLQGRFAEGWYFCLESYRYFETGNFSSKLAGNAPFIVDKDSGEILELGTAYPLEKYLQDYEDEKNNSAKNSL